ncbi:MAG: divalent cation tolerance protein CutA [Cytophagaceae bacterium]|nr:divalent cation tolerance protein CutA [Cytophagaceae bacterium]MDW8455559.1 divalent cation tolerance protein CutA [Cytophagaceae bacterium]
MIVSVLSVPDYDSAQSIAKILIEEKYAYEIHLPSPVKTYLSGADGKMEIREEYLILMKSRAVEFSKLEQRVKQLTDKKPFNLVSMPVTQMSKEYFEWTQIFPLLKN